jgi:hypothetical protein
VVIGSPSWANGVPASNPRHYVYVPARGPALDGWLGQYANFLAAAVKRYHRYVRRWEIWNEPNLAATWRPRPDPAAYRQVYERLRATILSVDPKAQVAVGGLTELSVARSPDISGLAFLRSLIRSGAPIGNVAIHPYPSNDHPPGVHIPGQNNFDDIGRVHDLLVRNRVRASIWITELGWSSAIVGKERQAEYVDSSLTMLARRYPYVRLAIYFLDHDAPPTLFQGLLEQNLAPKPAAFAFHAHAAVAAAECRARSGKHKGPTTAP